MNDGEIATRLGLPGIPAYAEVMMIERDLHLVRASGARYHVAHVSTAAAVDAIRAAKAEGLRVTCDTAPPYFSLNETEIGDYRTFAKLSPPLRGEPDRRAVVDGLGRRHDRLHRQRSRAARLGEQARAVRPGRTRRGRARDAAADRARARAQRHALACSTLLDQLTRAPADLLGLDAGRLASAPGAISCCSIPTRPAGSARRGCAACPRTRPFDGRLVQGKVLRTLVDGRTIYEAASQT